MKALSAVFLLATLGLGASQNTETPIPTYTITSTPIPTWTHTPTPVPTATPEYRTWTPTPPPPQPGNVHSAITVAKANLDGPAFMKSLSTELNIHEGSMGYHLVAQEGATDVHVYVVGGVKNEPMGAPFAAADIVAAMSGMAQKATYAAMGTYPVTAVGFELNADMQYECGTCEYQHPRTFDAPCDKVMDTTLPALPLASNPADTEFKNVLAVMAAFAKTKTPVPTWVPPTQTPLPTPTPAWTATPIPTQTPTRPPPRPDSPQCGSLIAMLACPRAYPFCHKGAPLKVCKSQCTAVNLFCSEETIAGLKLVSQSLLDCDSSADFVQTYNAPSDPCLTIFDLGYLFNPKAPCSTKTPVPVAEFVPVGSWMNATTIDGTVPVRSYAVLHVTKSPTEAGKTKIPNSNLDALAKDVRDAFNGLSYNDFFISPYVSNSSVANAVAVSVYFNGTKIGDKYMQGRHVKAVFEAAVKTAGWKSRWGETTVKVDVRQQTTSCESCEVQSADGVHSTCRSMFDEMYSGGTVAAKATVTSMDNATFELLVAQASAVALGSDCLSYMKMLACGLSYGPCSNGQKVRPCSSYCDHMSKFCSPDNIGLVKGAPESAGLADAFFCNNSALYVQPGSTEKCWDAYDNHWLATQPTCQTSGPPPVVPVSTTTKFKAADPNPGTIHVCGGCSGGRNGDPITCPADASMKFDIRSTRCIELPVGVDKCLSMSTCGKQTPSASANYKYTGTSANGTLQFYSDAACTTPTTSLPLSEAACTNSVRLVPGGYSVATVEVKFEGTLTAEEKNAVEAAFAAKFASSATFQGLEVEFIWVDATRRQAATTLQVEFGAPNNVESSSSSKTGAALSNDAATLVGNTINDDATFQSSLTSAAGGKTVGKATVTAAPTEDDGSSSVLIFIIIIVILLIIVGAAAAVWFFVVAPNKSKSPKVKTAGTYDDEEDGYAGRAA